VTIFGLNHNLANPLFIFLVAAMGMGLCVAFIALVRLPSLKVSTLLLTGLLIYDVFWVFFSSYIFSTNVMVKVSQQTPNN
jgi:signal peptide peptidase-like 3